MAIREVTEGVELVAAGTYPAIVKSLEDTVLKNVWDEDEGERVDREVIEWTILLLAVDGEYKEQTAISSRIFSSGSKAGKWTKNLTGDLPDGSFDDDDLIGQPCMVKVVQETKTTKRGTFTNSNVREIQEPLDVFADAYTSLQQELRNRLEQDDVPF